jgi:hypothetical protein
VLFCRKRRQRVPSIGVLFVRYPDIRRTAVRFAPWLWKDAGE